MLSGSIIAKATDQQKHGAQSEAVMRSVSPMGVFAKAAPSIFQNEERFTAAHSSRPVGATKNKRPAVGG